MLLKILFSLIVTMVWAGSLQLIWTKNVGFDIESMLASFHIKARPQRASAHRLDINYKNSFFSKFINASSALNDHVGLAFYEIDIVNTSTTNLTVKEVVLKYRFKGREFEEDSHVVKTHSVFSPLEKKEVETAIFENQKLDRLSFMGWKNLRPELAARNLLLPGGVLKGSAYFVLHVKNPDELKEVSDMEIIVRDFLGQVTRHAIQRSETEITEARSLMLRPL